MLPMVKNYQIFPSVVPADTEVEMTVVPTEKAFLLVEGRTYEITVIDVDGDEPNYHDASVSRTVSATATGGVLRFRETFAGEGEHLLLLKIGEKKFEELSIYSLESDLYALRPLRGDFHAHSFRSDGRRDPAALAGHFREQGYDFFALTDHNRFYPGGEIDETYKDLHLSFSRVRGEEVHAPGSVIHIIHVGGDSSVADLYVKDREGYEAAIEDYLTRVPANVPEEFRDRYARSMWVTDRIHERNGLAIFPHPFWVPGGSRMHNVRVEYAELLLRSGMFDGYELIGGMTQGENNHSVAMWNDLRADGLKISVVGSSDVHGIQGDGTFPNYFTVCFAEKNENDAIIAAVKQGNCVAVEAVGANYGRQYRCYGQRRLVSYAQFLFRHYFPHLQRMAAGEGVMMRTYAMGFCDGAIVEGLAEQTRRYGDEFFGAQPPRCPSRETLDFEDKWRAVHLDGPISKGSLVYTDKVNRQI